MELEHHGVEWVRFSPLNDNALPEKIDGVYLGGGRAESFGSELSGNESMRKSISRFACSGGLVYAEASGLIVLARSHVDFAGRQHAMAGILPLDTAEMETERMFGRVEVQWIADSPWGPADSRLRGFELRRFDILAEDGLRNGWERLYTVHRRRIGRVAEGFVRGNVVSSFVHLYWAGDQRAMLSFVRHAKAVSRRSATTG